MHFLQHKQNANAENFKEVVIEFLGMEFDLAMCGRKKCAVEVPLN